MKNFLVLTSAALMAIAGSSGFAANQDPFPDFGFMLPPAEYSGPVFKLSQNYPATLPAGPLPEFFKTDFKKDWRKYLEQVQDYCFEGNTEVDFRVENNKARDWYHMPWQHYTNNGREGIHGLTQEAGVKAYQLAPTQSIGTAGAVAVGFYNNVAGYTIGQVWKDHYAPDVSKDVAFQNGAVLFKLLFVTLSPEEAPTQVPWLDNGIWWEGYLITDFTKLNDPNPAQYRHRAKVALIQMDIMVRDDRAPTGWIMGNFQYNGAMKKANPWKNLVPVGIQWGDDPKVTTNASNPKPTKTIINPDLKETIINPDTNELPATHLGWNSRLNGPVDNPMSSCMSCHSTAEYPQLAPMSPLFDSKLSKDPNYQPGAPGWMRWFANLRCGTPFDKKAKSMDFSLQLAISLQNFFDWKKQQAGLFDSAYKPAPPPNRAAAQPQLRMAAPAPAGEKVYRIVIPQ